MSARTLIEWHVGAEQVERKFQAWAEQQLGLTARVTVNHRDRPEVALNWIKTSPWGHGIGERALRELTRLADQHGVVVKLTVDGADPDRLTRWYRRHGFEGEGVMVREPKRMQEAFRPPTQPVPVESVTRGAYWLDRSGNFYPTKTPKYPSNEHNQWACQAMGLEFDSRRDFREELKKLGWARVSAVWSSGSILVDAIDLTPSQRQALVAMRDNLSEQSGDRYEVTWMGNEGQQRVVEARKS